MTEFEQMILQKFDSLEKDVEGIKTTLDTDVKNIRTDVNNIKTEVNNIKTDVNNIKTEVKSIKLTLENDISPSIKLLSELQLENSKRLINLERDVQELKDDMAINDVLAELEKLKVN